MAEMDGRDARKHASPPCFLVHRDDCRAEEGVARGDELVDGVQFAIARGIGGGGRALQRCGVGAELEDAYQTMIKQSERSH